jgi:CubicO group peptidase (beta-lactamase class C family)
LPGQVVSDDPFGLFAQLGQTAGEKLSDYIPRLATTPLDFQPGTRWQYSATAAWDTLERVVEIVTGEPFDHFARERIFDPLGMKDTGFVASPEQLKRIATRYRGPMAHLPGLTTSRSG